MQSRSAAYFNRFAKVHSQLYNLRQIVRNDKDRAKNLVEHKAELDRIYQLIEKSAMGGGIRIFLKNEDPLWANDAVKNELRMSGFLVNMCSHHSSGTIEWYHAKDKEDKDELK